MTNDTRTSDDIESDIQAERAQMTDTIGKLQKKFSIDAIMDDIGAMFGGRQGDLGRSISDTVGRNPAAVALVGVGLAWLILGQDRKTPSNTNRQSSGGAFGQRASRSASRSDDDQAMGRANADSFRDDDAFWYGDGQMSSDYRSQPAGSEGFARKRATAGHGSNGIVGTVRKAADAAAGAVADASGTLGAAASDLTERLSDGLGDLPAEARSRVIAARRAAHDARLAASAAMKTGMRAASGFFEDHPLVVGTLAVAFGAAVGGILPHSRIEDDTMGDSSDQLFEDAQALFRAERAKAMAAMKMAAKDAKGEVRDIGADLADLLPEGKSVGDVIVDRASDAAMRVVDHATGDKAGRKQDQSPT